MLKAFTWPFWLRHRIVLGIILGTLLAMKLVLLANSPERTINAQEVYGPVQAVAMGVLYVLLVTSGLVFIGRLANGDSPNSLDGDKGGGSAYPAFMLTLPASNGWMVFAPMLFGSICFLAIGCLLSLLFVKSSDLRSIFGFGLFLVSLTLCLQTVTWSRISLPFLKVLLACTLMLGGIGLAFAMGQGIVSSFDILRIYGALATLAIVVVAPAFGRARHGFPVHILRLRSNLKPKRLAKVIDVCPFKSAFATQVWLDWKKQGLDLPIITAILVPIFAGLDLDYHLSRVSSESTFEWHNSPLPMALLSFLLFIAFATGVAPRRSKAVGAEGPLDTFISTRPMSGTDFVLSKFLVAGFSSTVSWLGIACTLLFWMVFPTGESGPQLTLASQSFDFSTLKNVCLTIVSLLSLLVVIWSAQTLLAASEFSGRRWLSAACTGVLVIGLIWVAIKTTPASEYTWTHDQVRIILWTALAVKLCFAAFSADKLWRRRLIAGKMIANIVLAWASIAAMFSAAYIWCGPDYLSDKTTLVPGILLLIPLARLFVSPLTFEWNRHR